MNPFVTVGAASSISILRILSNLSSNFIDDSSGFNECKSIVQVATIVFNRLAKWATLCKVARFANGALFIWLSLLLLLRLALGFGLGLGLAFPRPRSPIKTLLFGSEMSSSRCQMQNFRLSDSWFCKLTRASSAPNLAISHYFTIIILNASALLPILLRASSQQNWPDLTNDHVHCAIKKALQLRERRST